MTTFDRGMVVKIVQSKGRLYPVDQFGQEVHGIPAYTIELAWKKSVALEFTGNRWRQVSMAVYDKTPSTPDISPVDIVKHAVPVPEATPMDEIPETHDEIVNFIRDSYKYKPRILKVSELNWRFAVRSIIRGDNLLILGESGFGKTLLATTLKDVFGRPFFYFNLGATQDPRTTLIGTKNFSPEKGTYVSESLFAQAIQTPDAIILLDEVSRAHPDANNILLSVLDRKQRYLRIDEHPDSPTISVAGGVSFIGTANVGSQYTATRVMDLAFVERWKILAMPFLSFEQEVELLTEMFPQINPKLVEAVAHIATITREEIKSDSPNIDKVVSTRTTTEMAELLHDGFTLEEVAEVKIFPFFSDAGGAESPQSFMRRLVQKYIVVDGAGNPIDQFSGKNPNKGSPIG